MKLLVINGIPLSHEYLSYEAELELALTDISHDLRYFKLRDMKIAYCTGCWDCWVKTPGYCSIKDDQALILKELPDADKVLFISPIIAGYESSLIKRTKDRMIPLVHPYITVYQGEQHHRQRYSHAPIFQVVMIKSGDTTDEDIHIMKDTYQRVALNFKTSVQHFEAINHEGGITNVISHL